MRPDLGKARDPELLEAVDRCERTVYNGLAWRAVREGRDPLEPSRINGRWNMGRAEVLYTALEYDGAIAEIAFQLAQQPVFPSKYRAKLYTLKLRATRALRFDTVEQLQPYGVDPQRYAEVLYARTQEIGDVAAFLGFDALISPNARWRCLNLMLIMDQPDLQPPEIVDESPIELDTWMALNRRQHRFAHDN